MSLSLVRLLKMIEPELRKELARKSRERYYREYHRNQQELNVSICDSVTEYGEKEKGK